MSARFAFCKNPSVVRGSDAILGAAYDLAVFCAHSHLWHSLMVIPDPPYAAINMVTSFSTSSQAASVMPRESRTNPFLDMATALDLPMH